MTVLALTIAPSDGAPLEPREEITVITGVGIEGDRHAGRTRQVTVVSTGELAEAAGSFGSDFDGVATRRNIVVDAGALPRRHGARFSIGEVELEVWRDCAPCNLMDETFGDGAKKALRERCGIAASVVSGGTIRIGDPITLPA